MNTQAAEDMAVIRQRMEYEKGLADGFQGKPRLSPDGCTDRTAWLDGYDYGARHKPKEE